MAGLIPDTFQEYCNRNKTGTDRVAYKSVGQEIHADLTITKALLADGNRFLNF